MSVPLVAPAATEGLLVRIIIIYNLLLLPLLLLLLLLLADVTHHYSSWPYPRYTSITNTMHGLQAKAHLSVADQGTSKGLDSGATSLDSDAASLGPGAISEPWWAAFLV